MTTVNHTYTHTVDCDAITQALDDARRVARLLPPPAASELHELIDDAERTHDVYDAWRATTRALALVTATPSALLPIWLDLTCERLEDFDEAVEQAARLPKRANVHAWDPWVTLWSRPHMTLEWTTFDDDRMGTCECHDDGTITITLDTRLTNVEATATLAHEIVHAERGGWFDVDDDAPAWLRALVKHEEQLVDNEVARRLVPLDQLDRWIEDREDFTVDVTAAEFDVPASVARDALRLRL